MPRYSLLALLLSAACSGGGAQQGANPAQNAAPKEPTVLGGCGAPTNGEELQTTDINSDGLPEVCKYYKEIDDPERPGRRRNLLVRQDVDVNWDGKVDIKRLFDASGTVTKEEWDADYDGRVDEVRLFESGTIVRSERDQNNDGSMDVFRYYADGQLERKETDSNGDGQTDRWEYYRGRVLDRVGVDKDHDGTVDSWAKAAPSAQSK